MSKPTFQDIVPPEPEKSIRKIPLSKNRTGEKPQKDESESQARLTRTLSGGWKGIGTEKQNRGLPKKTKLFGSLIILILIAVFFSVFGRSSADVKLTARQLSHNFDIEIIANKDGTGVTFEILEISKEAEKIVPAQGEEQIERKASGEIIIYNKHSTNPQILIRNTRFETSSGLIYRIEDGITVPGMTERNGETTPGQIKVKVYADEAGERYNIGLVDFTIPGFKGLPQYENFFARSATPMTGGFVGKVKKVEEETLKKTRTELQNDLEKTLLELALTSSKDNYIILTESLETRFSQTTEDEVSGNQVKIKERGEMSGIKIDKVSLEKVMTSSVLGEQAEKIKIENLEKMVYKINEPKVFSNLANLNNVTFEIKGLANLVWQIDSVKIQEALAGQPKREITSILSKNRAVEQAEATVKPFWKRSFPSNPKKIKVEVQS